MNKTVTPKTFLHPDSTILDAIKRKAAEYEEWTGITPGTVYLGNMEMRKVVAHLSREEREKILNWPHEDVYVHGMRVVQVKLQNHLDVSWVGNAQWKQDVKRNGTYGHLEGDE